RLAARRLYEAVERRDVLDPVAIGPRRRQHVLDLAVAVEAARGEVDADHLAWTQAALLDDLGLVEPDHAGLGAGDDEPTGGHGVAHRPEAVAVHAAQHPAPV